jgi:regulator of protease activity HflC (stomatin/prohibitin superfamily)
MLNLIRSRAPIRQCRRSFLCIIDENTRGVKLNFGKYRETLEPGIRLNIPILHEIYTVSLADRVQHLDKQSIISKDNVSFYIDSSIQYKVTDAKSVILNITDFKGALIEKTQMAIRQVLSSLEINEILHDMTSISDKIKLCMPNVENDWGIRIASIQIKDISFDESMKRAMAVKAEADRNAQAKIINAEADIKTAEMYSQAAKIYGENPITMRLREFQLWNSVSKNPGSTIYVVPSNIADMVSTLKK